MASPNLSDPGPSDAPCINGTVLDFPPQAVSIIPTLAQSEQPSAAGRSVFSSLYVGDGYPDVSDSYEFEFPFGLSDATSDEGTTLEFLKKLRKRGGIHTLVLWMKEAVYWTAATGDTNFYLPRLNAPSNVTVSGHGEADDPITFKVSTDSGVNWTTRTVVMKATVATSDAPGAGNVWIGRTDRQIKLGDTPAATTLIEAVYVPLYRVVVVGASSNTNIPRLEPISLRLRETIET